MKHYRKQGVGGVAGALLAFILVSVFLLPAYVGRMYNEDGNPNNPVSGLSGFWVLIPYAGVIIWLYKVHDGAQPVLGVQGRAAGGPGLVVRKEKRPGTLRAVSSQVVGVVVGGGSAGSLVTSSRHEPHQHHAHSDEQAADAHQPGAGA